MAKHYLVATAAADISDASGTDQFTMEAPFAGNLRVNECFVRWTEATGTQTTTQGVLSILVAGTSRATLTANRSDAIGQTQAFATTTAGDSTWNFAAGDTILVEVLTQAVDGTTVGDGDVYLALEWGV